MLQSALTTSVRYLSNGKTAVWPVPFPYSQASAVLAKAIAPDGSERELVQGRDCVLSGNQLFCVLPAGHSLLVWLNENEEDALKGWRPAPPPCAPPPPHHVPPPPPDPARLQLAERLAALEAAQKEAIEAARKAEADALVKELVQTGKGQQKLLQSLGENLAKSQQAGIEASGAAQISRLEELAATLARAVASAEEATARAGQLAADAAAALERLQGSLDAIQAEQSQKARELLASLRADLDGAAGQAVKDAQGHSQQSGSQAARAAAAAMRAEAGERAASEAAADAQSGARSARAYAAAGEAQAKKAQAASEASAASEEESRRLANQAWHSAVTAQLWGRRPGVAAVACFEDLYHVCSGLYVINPHLSHLHSPSPFMGVWPVESVADIAFDGLFFIGLPYPQPDQPEDRGCCSARPCGQEPCPGAVCVTCPRMRCPCRPQKPGGPEKPSQPAEPDNPQDSNNNSGHAHWLPCDHTHG